MLRISAIVFVPFAGDSPLVMKLDIIGMDPDKKYNTDPMLTPKMYKKRECISQDFSYQLFAKYFSYSQVKYRLIKLQTYVTQLSRIFERST